MIDRPSPAPDQPEIDPESGIPIPRTLAELRELAERDPRVAEFLDRLMEAAGAPGQGGQMGEGREAPAAPPHLAEGGLVGAYDTPMPDARERDFQAWAKRNGKNVQGEREDYDIQGAYLAQEGQDDRGHMGDRFKKPNHPTFSDQSQYHGQDGNEGGHWSPNGGIFEPGPTNYKHRSPAEIEAYMRRYEPDTVLKEQLPKLADGGLMSPPETQDAGDTLTSPDGRLMVVGVPHGQAPSLSEDMKRTVRERAAQSGAYYEGNGDDREPVTKALGEINYKGSFDDLVPPPENKSDFLYTLFSNPEPQMASTAASLEGPGSIRDSLVRNRDRISHESVRGHLSDADVDTFLDNAGMRELANLPATAKNLADFMQQGAGQMWPDNWQDFPNPAGKIAERASMHRLKAITDRGEGVFFVGKDNLPLLRRMIGKGERPGFADGGFMSAPETEVEQAGGNIEPVPPGSLPEEVADDIDAKLSVGELVIPADVVRWHGVALFERLRTEAKEGFGGMQAEGRVQSPGGLMEPPEVPEEMPEEEPPLPFDESALDHDADQDLKKPLGFAAGGYVAPQGFMSAPYTDQFGRGTFAQAQPTTTAMPTAPGVGAPAAPAAPVAAAPVAPPAPTTDTSSGASAWMTPAAIAAAAAGTATTVASNSSPAAASASGPSVEGFLTNAAESFGIKTGTRAAVDAIGNSGSWTPTSATGEGVAGSGNLLTDAGNAVGSVGDAIGEGATSLGKSLGDTFNSAGDWITGKLDSVGDYLGNLSMSDPSSFVGGASVGDIASSLGSSLATAGATFAGGYAGNLVGKEMFGPGDADDLKWIMPVATGVGGVAGGMALGASIGSVIPGFGTAIGAAIGAFVGAIAGNAMGGEPDVPYMYSGGAITADENGPRLAFNGGYAMNGGKADYAAKLGDGLTEYVNSRAAQDGLIINPEMINTPTGFVGYKAGEGYFYDLPENGPGGDSHGVTVGTARELADVAYGDMVNRGFLVKPGTTATWEQVQANLNEHEAERQGFMQGMDPNQLAAVQQIYQQGGAVRYGKDGDTWTAEAKRLADLPGQEGGN